MKILMIQTRYGSEDGFVVRRFIENQEYEMADSLAAYFIRIGVAYHPVKCEALAQDPIQS